MVVYTCTFKFTMKEVSVYTSHSIIASDNEHIVQISLQMLVMSDHWMTTC